MGIYVAEYLGQRTDIDTPVITPVTHKMNCPFTHNNPCIKSGRNRNPVCCVRKEDGTLWIVCQHRLCSTKKDLALCSHQTQILLDIACHLYNTDFNPKDIIVKREVPLKATGETEYKADYIMAFKKKDSHTPGPDKLIVEMQGGGETSGTEKMTDVLANWKQSSNPTNELLRSLSGASPLPANAWRRQQEQFIVKGNIAMQTWRGYGIAFCVGTILFDYLKGKIDFESLPDLHQHNWTLALVGIKEDVSQTRTPGPIPLIVDEERLLFTNYQTFVHALINQGLPSPEAFVGDFISLRNKKVTLL